MSVIPEIVFQTVIARGIHTLREDTRFVDQLFRSLSQKAQEQLRDFIKTNQIDLRLNYPRTPLSLPSIVILMKSDSESAQGAYLGDSMGHEVATEFRYDEYDEDLEILGGAASVSTMSGLGEVVFGPAQVMSATNNTLKAEARSFATSCFVSGQTPKTVHIISGTGKGQVREITANSSNVIMVSPNWQTVPDGTSVFQVREPSREVIGEPSKLYSTRERTLERRGGLYTYQYQIQLIGANPQQSVYLYSILKAIFTLSRIFMESQGIINLRMSGTDVVNRPEGMPDNSYMRVMRVEFESPFDVFEADGSLLEDFSVGLFDATTGDFLEDPIASGEDTPIIVDPAIAAMSVSTRNGVATVTDLSSGDGIFERIIEWGDGQSTTGEGPWTHTYYAPGLPATVTLTLRDYEGNILDSTSETIEWWKYETNFQEVYDTSGTGEVFKLPILSEGQTAKFYVDVPEGFSGLSPKISAYGSVGGLYRADLIARKDVFPTEDTFDVTQTVFSERQISLYWGPGRWYFLIKAKEPYLAGELRQIALAEEGPNIGLLKDPINIFGYNNIDNVQSSYPIVIPEGLSSFTIRLDYVSGFFGAAVLYAPETIFSEDSEIISSSNPTVIITVNDPAPGTWYLVMDSNGWNSGVGDRRIEATARVTAPILVTDNSTPTLDGEVQFTAQLLSGLSGSSWLWDFGDGNTSTEQNPSHVYAVPGQYAVTVTVIEETLGELSDDVAVIEIPEGGDILVDLVNAPEAVFSHSDVYIYTPQSWLWDFGDGNTSTEQNPTHIYADFGIYTVSLTISTVEGPVISNTIEIEIITTLLSVSSITVNEPIFYVVDVAEGFSTLTFDMSGGTGDIDLYVRFGAIPTEDEWDYRPFKVGNNELVSVTNPTAGQWHIMLNPFSNGIVDSLKVTAS